MTQLDFYAAIYDRLMNYQGIDRTKVQARRMLADYFAKKIIAHGKK